jgi:hypothetical protein
MIEKNTIILDFGKKENLIFFPIKSREFDLK